MPSFYQSLHHQLGPLQRPLLVSTSPHKVAERLWQSPSPKRTSSIESSQPISDLVYDPVNLTIHTTIPNIPEPCNATGSELGPQSSSWSRVEALSVHSQILDTYALTRPRVSEVERTCKTNRGWWVVWMRLPSPLSSAMHHPHGSLCREAFLIRKTSDSVSPLAKKSGGKFRRDGRGSSPSSGWGAGKLADGIGIDTRQYIQGLLSLNR